MTPGKIELGKMLFFERRLSGDGTMSCASCHVPETGFTDGLDIALSYPTTRNWRNTPTLINVAFARYMFHDGRDLTLEEQALFPIMSSFEMNQNLDFLEEELKEVPRYVEAFQKVFGGEITRERIALALAAFQRTLVSRNSPLDRYLKGKKGALSEEARRGLEIFTGKGGCSRCHYGVNLSDNSFHALYVPDNPKLAHDPGVTVTVRFVAKVFGYEDYRGLREDPGRYLVTKDRNDWKAIKTPTLRDVSRTAPYMHNGVFGTLEEVIDFVDRGGGKGNRELRPLGLSSEEKKYLKAFLVEALTGEEIVIEFPELPG
jgi:cytochrome c peroxidase